MTNDNRPADFDARVMSYWPGLLGAAFRYERDKDARYDLAVDTVAYALGHWQSFREDGGFFNWLKWCMRSIISNRSKGRHRTLLIADDPNGSLICMASVPPAQEHSADLSIVLKRIQSMPAGQDLLQAAMGASLREIADGKVTPQTIELRIRRLRARLQDAA